MTPAAPAPTVDTALLSERLAALAAARPWSTGAVESLGALVRTAPDGALFRLGPLAHAARAGLEPREAIDLFLHATHAGLFRMNWELLCPMCSGTVESLQSLGRLHRRYYCALCHLETDAQLDDYIRVSFTVAPEVRRVRFHAPDSLTIDELAFRYSIDPDARLRDGTLEVDALRSIVHGLAFVEPGERRVFTLDAVAGSFAAHDFRNRTGFVAAVTGPATATAQRAEVTFRGGVYTPAEGGFAPGPIELHVVNASPDRAAIAVVNLPADVPVEPLVFAPFLTGNRVLTSQTFRTLFRVETLSQSEALGVRELTFVFTDLKGSTALYERIGDMRAFALVRQHFDRVAHVVAERNGAVVKTIGDAVMAAFTSPADAVSASLDMLAAIAAFNREQGADDVLLKIGAHRGAAIAVTLNDRNDYFGQTVNIAARVQGLAGAEEICLTREVASAPGVPALLGGRASVAEDAVLKGIGRPVPIVRLGARAA